ncbi:hypothetical protein J4221_06360 [Candidatus Pacearchaeota archaeon]|nr:hypothetical protein [Candidatus Pacearchaeota archaeon]
MFLVLLIVLPTIISSKIEINKYIDKGSIELKVECITCNNPVYLCYQLCDNEYIGNLIGDKIILGLGKKSYYDNDTIVNKCSGGENCYSCNCDIKEDGYGIVNDVSSTKYRPIVYSYNASTKEECEKLCNSIRNGSCNCKIG